MENFNALGLPQPLLSALEKMQFSTPTPIQAQAVPFALEGRDILGSAQTGTGKTAAFAIPLITRLINNPNSMAIVMTPTRELAAQVLDAMKKMLVGSQQIKAALLIGGESMFKQLNQLKARPRIIVGTPGRINDHLERRSLNLSTADFLVLDETDRMLDMGFGPQIDRILACMPKQRQTLLFSATLPPHIVKIAERYMNNPQRVAVGVANAPIKKIQQEVVRLQASEKYSQLLQQLRSRAGSVIIFVKTKHGADRMAKKLNDDDHVSAAIHGNLNQNQRNRVIQAFRDQKHRIMVATDVAARGLDIPHIEHVINYDLPQVAEDYIHRIGRTARAGAEGSAVCFVTPQDFEMWGEIDQLLNPGAPREARPAGKASNPKAGRSFGGNKSFGAKKSFGEKKSFGGKPENRYADKSGFNNRRPGGYAAEHTRSDAPRAERSFDKPQRSFDKPRSDRPYNNDRPERSFDKPRAERSYSNDRPERSFDKPERSFDKPQRSYNNDRPERSPERSYDKPRSDRPYNNDRPRSFDKPERSFDKPQRSFDGDRPRGDRPYKAAGDRPYKAAGDRPYKASGDRPYKPAGERSFDKPRSDRPYKPAGDRPYKAAGDRPFKKEGGYQGDKPQARRGNTGFKAGGPKKPFGKSRRDAA